ncbi:MAG: four helix bundle protein [Bacteroidaceae bacterium]|nr:four helix bundle protein [Bacteroidaceae bacterium]
MKQDNLIKNRSKEFAILVIRTVQTVLERTGFVEKSLLIQLLRSGTSIGANVREAEHAESKIDFIHKMKIALKEANETAYWLELLHETNYLDETQFQVLNSMCVELNRVLISIVKTTKDNISNNS